LVPTKDRPEKIFNLLDSITKQTILCGRIIIVDGGSSVEKIVMDFSDRLPVEYYTCSPPGQIRQRNIGISLLDGSTPLVGSIDDDIVMEQHALEAMIDFWNRCESETAGVSFNIINLIPMRYTWLNGVMGLGGPVQGQVLRSGCNTPIFSVANDLRTQWLCGGATVWKQEILKKFINVERYAHWAIAEDLIFSYPIGKHYPLYVCAAAKVRHEHVFDHNIKMKYKYYGRTETLWRFYFVESNKELSRTVYLWSQFTTIIARLIMGISLFQIRHIQFAIGQIEGVILGVTALFRRRSLSSLLNEPVQISEKPAKDKAC